MGKGYSLADSLKRMNEKVKPKKKAKKIIIPKKVVKQEEE